MDGSTDRGALNRRTLDRRTLLRLAGAGGIAALAGCSDGDAGAGTPDAPEPTGGWPAFGHDAANTGHADDAGPGSYGALDWRATVPRSSPASVRFGSPVAAAGVALVAAADGRLRALSLADGRVRWTTRAAPGTPAVSGETCLYRGLDGETGPVHAVDAATGETGDAGWTRSLPRPRERGGITVGDAVYVTGGPRAVYALDRTDGSVRWESESADSVGPPALDGDRDRVLAATESGLRAYDASTGERLWGVGTAVTDAPSVAGGRAFVGTESGVRAVTTAGESEWRADVGRVPGTPAVAGERVVAATASGTVVALSAADGTEGWRTGVGGGIAAPVAVADGVVYVPTRREELVALSLSDGSERWRTWTRHPLLAAPAVLDGGLFLGNAAGWARRLRNLDGGLSFPDVGAFGLPNADAANTNRVDARLPADPSVRWRSPLDVESGRPLVAAGRLFLGRRDGVFALDAGTGGLDWRFALGDQSGGARMLAVAGGSVLAAVGEGLRAFELAPESGAGETRWRTSLSTGRTVTAATATDGTVYAAATVAGELAALDAATGEVRWSFSRGSGFSHPPAVGAEHVYVGTTVGDVYALERASGELVAETGIGGQAGPLAVREGRAFTATADGEVKAVDVPAADRRWATELGTDAGVRAPLAVTDRAVYALALDGRVEALDPASGERLAGADLPAGSGASPRVVGDSLLVGSRGPSTPGRLYALSVDDLSERWSVEVFGTERVGGVAAVVPVGEQVYVAGPVTAMVG